MPIRSRKNTSTYCSKGWGEKGVDGGRNVGLTAAPGVHVLDVNVVWDPCAQEFLVDFLLESIQERFVQSAAQQQGPGTPYKCQDVIPHIGSRAVQSSGAGMACRDPRGSREVETPAHDVGERWVFRNPAGKVNSSVGFSPSLFHSLSDNTHPAGKVWRRELGDIENYRFLISSAYDEGKFGEIYQTTGPQGLAGLVDKADEVPYPRSNQASVDHAELFKVMLETEIDIVDFAPAIGGHIDYLHGDEVDGDARAMGKIPCHIQDPTTAPTTQVKTCDRPFSRRWWCEYLLHRRWIPTMTSMNIICCLSSLSSSSPSAGSW